ncbi:MAG: hypothetical protein RLP44_23785 [Aggregatilineales bacterium]
MRYLRVILFAWLLLLAGCGGSGSEPDATAQTVSEATAEATPEPTLLPTELPTTEPTEEPTAEATEEITAEATEEAVAIAQQSEPDCSQIVDQVLNVVDNLCEITGRNQICYGNVDLTVQPQPQADSTALVFASPGDIASLTDIQSISMSALDLNSNVWGVALMRLQADIPDTIPGQNVTFLLFGDVQMENRGEGETSLRSFYFTTGVGDAPCQEAPDSGILVQTPDGVGQVNFQVNAVDITLGSTAYLQAEAGRDLIVNVVEGQAEVEAHGIMQIVDAGNRTTIALDEQGNATGEPTAPLPYTASEIRSIDIPVESLPEEIIIVPPAIEVEQAYNIGDEVTSDLGQPGEIDVYNFSVTDADDYYFAALGEEGRVYWQLRDAENNFIFNDYEMWLYNDPGAFTLGAGEYSLRVAGQNGTQGDYIFQMWQIPEAQTFSMDVGNLVERGVYGEGSGVLEQPGAVDIYTFTPNSDRPTYFASFGEGENATLFWQLTDPTGTVLFEDQLWFGNDMGAFDLSTDTEYTITVTARGNEVGDYNFQTWYVPEAQNFDLTLGEVINAEAGDGSGEIEQSGAVDVYTFTLADPQTIYLGGQTITDGVNLAWSLKSEDGAVIFEDRGLWSGNDPGEYALDAGTYQVFVFGEQGQIGAYEIIVRDAIADQSFEGTGLNESYAGTIDAPEQQQTYTITLPAFTTIYVDSIAGGGDVSWSLQNTDGEDLIFPTRSDFDLGRYTAGDTEETVNVVVFGRGGTGDYEFYLWVVPPDDFTTVEASPAEPFSEEGIITGNITIPGETNRYPFVLPPEIAIYIESIAGDGETRWTLNDSDGNTVIFPTRTDFDLGLASPDASQSYELVVNGYEAGTGEYAFKIWQVPPSPSSDAVFTPPETPIEDDSTVMSGEIPTPGMVAYYNFSAEAGQTLYFESINGDGETRWTVNDLNGNTVIFPTRTDFDLGRFTFEQAGDYFVYATGYEAGVGEFAFRIWDVPPDGEFIALISPAEPLDDPESTENLNSGRIASPGEQHVYTFSMEVGQTFYVQSLRGDGETRWGVNDLNGNTVIFPTRTDFDLGRYTVTSETEDGTDTNTEEITTVEYTLVVNGYENGIGDYAFRIWDVPEDTIRELSIGETISGELLTPGEQHRYTFSVEAGDSLFFAGDQSSNENVFWQIVDSAGETVAFPTRTDFDLGSQTYAEAGDYVLVIRGNEDGIGNYAFTVREE